MNRAISRLAPQPFFLEGQAGRLFCLYRPAVPIPGARNVLIVPPLAEEMNKSRRMFSLLAEQLGNHGIGTLLVDLFGTGDSEGDFADARWNIWQDDLARAYRWLAGVSKGKIDVLALRGGALLTFPLLRRISPEPASILLWAPVSRGELWMNQFLRLRVAAELLTSDSRRARTAPRDELADAGKIELGGYMFHRDLVAAIDHAQIDDPEVAPMPVLHWFEVVPELGRPISPASQRTIDGWRRAGYTIESSIVVGPAFWSATEIATIPELVNESTRVLVEKK